MTIIHLPRTVVCTAVSLVFAATTWAQDFRTDRVVLAPATPDSAADQLLVEAVKKRIEARSGATVNAEADAIGGLIVHWGVAGSDERFDRTCAEVDCDLPRYDGVTPPESYALKSLGGQSPAQVYIYAADTRGLVYGIGELLRRLTYNAEAITLPAIDTVGAPAYRFRGFSANQGGTMRRVTGARSWTEEELFDYVVDFGFAGANTFYAGQNGGALYDFCKSLGFMTETGVRPNQYRGEIPEEWQAGGLEGWEGDDWVCPSIPEARAALLAQWRDDFAKRAHHEVLRFFAGDPGGCRDERCAPWGRTFIELCEEIADIWLELHPNSKVLIANQDLSNAGDAAIFDYINAAPRDWLYGYAYGPGSNALSHYFRDELRNDLLIYPGNGPVNRYLKEIFHHLPPDKYIVHYSDITHWISAQYEVSEPERHVVKAYGRRTFHTRPKAYYDVFQSIMPFSEGDIIYSEGYHDEFHQYMWNRLLWNPNQSLDDVLADYCVYHFGPGAAPLMAEAMRTLESSLEIPLETNPGIQKYYDLVKQAGERIPKHRHATEYRWRLHMQKAALDRYNQLKLQRERGKEARVRELLLDGLNDTPLKQGIEKAIAILSEPAETEEMAVLRAEAKKLGEETEARYGVRNVGYFKLDEPFRPLDRLKEKLTEAQKMGARRARDAASEAVELTYQPTRPGNIFW